MLDPNNIAGLVYFQLWAELSDDAWFSKCCINSEGWNGCFQRNWGKSEHEYEIAGEQLSLGEWHTFRIELDPIDMKFTYYLDGQLLGSHVTVEAEELKQVKYGVSMGAWSDQEGKTIGYFDDVRIGPIGQ